VIFRRSLSAPSADGQGAPRPPLVRVDGRAALSRTLVALLPDVRRWLFRMLGPSAALDDAVQDALIALSEALPGLADPEKERAFARAVVVRVGYRYFKRREPVLPADEQLRDGGPLPDAELDQRRTLKRLHRALARLPDARRMAFVLCSIEGLSYAEAAELEGTSEGAMRARHMHARHELMRWLGAKDGGAHG
jgi:RNA polymerase sigma factor (sigma-70 family)